MTTTREFLDGVIRRQQLFNALTRYTGVPSSVLFVATEHGASCTVCGMPVSRMEEDHLDKHWVTVGGFMEALHLLFLRRRKLARYRQAEKRRQRQAEIRTPKNSRRGVK